MLQNEDMGCVLVDCDVAVLTEQLTLRAMFGRNAFKGCIAIGVGFFLFFPGTMIMDIYWFWLAHGWPPATCAYAPSYRLQFIGQIGCQVL